MLRLRTKTFNLTVKEPSAVKVDPNGFVQVYASVAEDGKEHEVLVAVAGPYDFLSCYDPEHVDSSDVVMEKSGQPS